MWTSYGVTLTLMVVTRVSARQCETSDDCPDHSPHCSDWGWCQWTDEYGTAGPAAAASADRDNGSCSSDDDCSPRFPVCSNLGYCTVKDYFEKSGIPKGDDKRRLTKDRPREDPRSIGGRGGRRQSNGSQKNNLRTNHNNRQKQQQQQLATALPEATASKQHLPVPGIRQQISTNQRPALKSRDQPSANQKPALKAVSLQVDYDDRKSVTTASEAARAAQDYYENYDYNYYTQFEVLRNSEDDRADKSIEHKIHQQFIGSTQQARGNNRRGRPQATRVIEDGTRGQRVQPVTSANGSNVDTSDDTNDGVTLTSANEQGRVRPVTIDGNVDTSGDTNDGVTLTSANVTGGCLNDCVNDCVSIAQLTAYRDCVGFCGKTCKD